MHLTRSNLLSEYSDPTDPGFQLATPKGYVISNEVTVFAFQFLRVSADVTAGPTQPIVLLVLGPRQMRPTSKAYTYSWHQWLAVRSPAFWFKMVGTPTAARALCTTYDVIDDSVALYRYCMKDRGVHASLSIASPYIDGGLSMKGLRPRSRRLPGLHKRHRPSSPGREAATTLRCLLRPKAKPFSVAMLSARWPHLGQDSGATRARLFE